VKGDVWHPRRHLGMYYLKYELEKEAILIKGNI
jgi:hypothetical protein